MSRTQSVTYAGCGFWAYDVALGIFLKYLVDAAEASAEANTPWLSNAVSSWRFSAVFGFGEVLREDWSAEQRNTFIALAEGACATLAKRASIPSEEILAWPPMLDDRGVFPRGAKEVLTAPVIELGCAIIDLLYGKLPKAPKGEAWYFGTPDGRSTIQMQDSWDGRW